MSILIYVVCICINWGVGTSHQCPSVPPAQNCQYLNQQLPTVTTYHDIMNSWTFYEIQTISYELKYLHMYLIQMNLCRLVSVIINHIHSQYDLITVGNPVVTTHKRYSGPSPLWQTIWAGLSIALVGQVQTPEWFWAAFSAANHKLL